MATHSGNRLPNLEALTNATVAVGDTGEILKTGNIYICTAADGAGSTWRPGTNIWRPEDISGTQNATQIQAALDRCDSVDSGGVVEVGPGVWTMNAQITIPASFITLRGVGQRATLLRGTSLAVPYIRTSPTVWSGSPQTSKIIIRDLGLDHATAGPAGSAGILIFAGLQCQVIDCDIRNLADFGIRFTGASHFCHAIRCDVRGGDDGVLFDDDVRSSYALFCDVKAATNSYRVAGGSNAGCSNNGILYCSGEGFTTGLVLNGATNIVFHTKVENNRFETSTAGATGVHNQDSSEFPILIDNFYSGAGLANKVVDDNPDGEMFSRESPVHNGLTLGLLTGGRGSLFIVGDGDPNGVLDGKEGDLYFRRDLDGQVYRKTTASGQTAGWIPATKRGYFGGAEGVF